MGLMVGSMSMEVKMDKGRWHGDSYAGQSHFYYTRATSSPDIHPPQFDAVWDRLHELAQVRDGNGWPVVRLVFTRRDHDHPVIAYRWTSDWAYSQYELDLVRRGGSLGRGVWQIWGSDPYCRWNYEHFVK
jgi:hypothetical protein